MRRQGLGAWLGILALLLYAAMPLASHGSAGALSQSFVELCTPEGLRLVEIPAGGSDEPGDATLSISSCPLCQAGCHAPGIVPTQAALPIKPPLPAVLPAPDAPDAPRPAAIPSLGSRAPPAIG